MSYSYTDIERKLCGIATANWENQILRTDGLVQDRSFFGRLLKLLGFTKFDWVRNTLFYANIGKGVTEVKAFLKASNEEVSTLPKAIKAELHKRVSQKVNSLIDHYNKRAPQKLASHYEIDLSKLSPEVAPLPKIFYVTAKAATKPLVITPLIASLLPPALKSMTASVTVENRVAVKEVVQDVVDVLPVLPELTKRKSLKRKQRSSSPKLSDDQLRRSARLAEKSQIPPKNSIKV